MLRTLLIAGLLLNCSFAAAQAVDTTALAFCELLQKMKLPPEGQAKLKARCPDDLKDQNEVTISVEITEGQAIVRRTSQGKTTEVDRVSGVNDRWTIRMRDGVYSLISPDRKNVRILNTDPATVR